MLAINKHTGAFCLASGDGGLTGDLTGDEMLARSPFPQTLDF
jgi:hypothetical protein